MEDNSKKAPLTKTAQARLKGQLAEKYAAVYLEQKGYTILERNWRWQRAEVDIIAKKGETLVIVEVKSRSSNTLGEPEESITPAKEAILIDAAGEYARQVEHIWELRIDIIAILFQGKNYQLRHFEDAIY